MAKRKALDAAEPTETTQNTEQTPKEDKLLSAGKSNLIEDLFMGTVEQTYRRSGYVHESYKAPYNPDDIYQKKGNYSIYEEMLYDDQVSICSNLKKDLILGSGYTIVPSDYSQEEICEEITYCLENIQDMSFLDKCREMLDAYEMGFSITEKVFTHLPDGRIALKDLLTRHPNSFLIHQDGKGNITKIEQKSTEKGDIVINPKSVIHYVNNPKYQNPYGKSDLRPAYNAWFVKRQVVRFLGIFLESSAKPIPVGRYDVNAPAGTADTLLEILKTFQIKTAITIPKEIQVDFLEAKSNGEAFHKAINIFNMFIGRAMFIPDLLGMSGSETSGGSLALGKEQMNIFFMHINRRKSTLEKLIQKHIVEPIVMYNYGDIKCPKFKLNPLDDQAAVELAKVWLDLVKVNKHKVSEEEVKHFLKLVKFPETDVEMKEEPEMVNPLDPNNPNQPNPEMENEEDDEENGEEESTEKEDESSEKENAEEIKEEIEKFTAEIKLFGGPGSGPQGGNSSLDKIDKITSDLTAAMDREEKAIAAIKSIQKSDPSFWNSPAYAKAAKELKSAKAARQKAVRAAKKELRQHKQFSARLPKGNYYKKVDFKAIGNKLDDYDKSILDETRPVAKKMFADLYEQIKRKNLLDPKNLSKMDSLSLKYKSELKRVLKQSLMQIYKDGQVIASKEIEKGNFALPTTSDEFLNLVDQEVFNYVGKYEYGIIEKVRQQLVAAVKDGLPLSTVIDVMDNEGKKLSEVSLERFARTKHTEVLNRGRHDFFESTGVVAAYQYSAILDDRTSEICSRLHGKIFAAGTEPIPPMHFNCRSLLIPITKYEEWKADEKVGSRDIETFIEEEKGDGFSKYSLQDLDFTTEHPDETTEVYTYFTKDKKAVEKITIKYSDYTHTKIESKVTEKLNEKV